MTPRIVVYGLSKCFSFGILLCFISVISAIFVFIMEYKADKNSPVEVHKDKEEEPGFTCSSLRKFNKLYWMIAIVVVCSEGVTWTFYGVLNKILTSKYGVSVEEAANFILIHFAI